MKPVAEPPKAEVVPTVVPTVVPEVSEGPPSSVTEAPPVSAEPPSEAPGSEAKEEVPEAPNSEVATEFCRLCPSASTWLP